MSNDPRLASASVVAGWKFYVWAVSCRSCNTSTHFYDDPVLADDAVRAHHDDVGHACNRLSVRREDMVPYVEWLNEQGVKAVTR